MTRNILKSFVIYMKNIIIIENKIKELLVFFKVKTLNCCKSFMLRKLNLKTQTLKILVKF